VRVRSVLVSWQRAALSRRAKASRCPLVYFHRCRLKLIFRPTSHFLLIPFTQNWGINPFYYNFFVPPLYPTPPLGGPRRTIAFPFGLEKLKWWVYPTVKKSLTICLRVLTECTNVTDRHTDRQTDRRTSHDGKGRAWYKHRAAKIVDIFVSCTLMIELFDTPP